ncbi:TrgA family protein [Pseudooceanicola sp. C21-150M6]|uniref:TrgA family protein n=1 Tax=Pseudooceanicola sp. C21-150M6 TaxID=3434355 RepID=UPI003D7FE04B
MPTAARVVAALLNAFLAWLLAGLAMAVMPDYVVRGYLVPISVVVGAACGWVILGRRSDYGRLGYPNGMGVGLSAIVATVLWVLAICASLRALDYALAGRYSGPIMALYDVVPIGLDFAMYLANVPAIATLVVGGMLVGAATHWASTKWR